MQPMDIKYLRGVRGTRITRRDRITSNTKRKELAVESVVKRTEQEQLNWFGHLIIMSDIKPVKYIWEGKTQKRPKMMCNDEIWSISSKEKK